MSTRHALVDIHFLHSSLLTDYFDGPGLEFQKDGSVVVRCPEGELVASKVFSALPAHKLAEVVQQSHSGLSTLLSSIKSVTVGMVNMEWPGKRLPYEAFGFLVPSTQGLPILGTVFDTCSFPQGDRTILTVMMGGRWFESLFGKNATKEDLYKVAVKQVEDVLNIREPPARSQVHIHQEWYAVISALFHNFKLMLFC